MDSSGQSQSHQHMSKTAHHTIAVILKEIACSPMPTGDSNLTSFVKGLASTDYNRKKLTEMLKKNNAARDYNEEEIANIAEKIEQYRGYNKDKIKDRIKEIKDEHGYSKQQMKKMLEKINESDHYSLLHYSALFNNIPFCQCLIEEYDCNVNLIGWDGETPLHIAARSADISKSDQTPQSSILLYLLKSPDIKVNIQDSQKRTPLHHAIMYDCVENAQYLKIDGKAELYVPDIQGATPLHYACRFHETAKMVSLFNGHEKLFDLITNDGKTPLDIAAEYGNLKIVETLFRHSDWKQTVNKSVSALVNVAVLPRQDNVLLLLKDENLLVGHGTALHLACRQFHGHTMISHLINATSILYQDKEDGFSPLMVAVQHRQLGCVKELLAHKNYTQDAFELTSPYSLRTVLHICAEVNQERITEELFESGYISDFLLKATDMMGNTALHVCAEVGNIDMTRRLLLVNTSAVSISKTTPYRTMTNLDSNGRVPLKSSPTITTTRDQVPVEKHVHTMLTKKNKSKLTPLHVAIHYGKLHIINEILRVADSASIIKQYDDQRRTSLHMAAEKGHDDIVKVLLDKKADVHACDINDCTPLHDAARCSKNQEDNIKRAECIKLLVKDGMADINALNIRRETPLHIASEYGSSELITCLFELAAEPFAINVDGFNCLEVAIEENNEEVVKFLIKHEHAFDLMRNAQIRNKKETNWFHSLVNHDEADTPMRKLIRQMPKLALLMLDKCSMIVGTEGTHVHKEIFVYEFLDDQYTIKEWAQGNSLTKSINETSKLYTTNAVNLVMNHPLFIMASCEATELMAHRLSNRLVLEKFLKFGIFLFGLFILLYAIFLALFTTIVLRTSHPQQYYNLTNFADLDDALCYNVSQALTKGLSGVGGVKTSTDYVLKYFLYIIVWLNILKNIGIIIEVSRVNITKTVSCWMEIVALVFSFIFTYDQSYQIDLTFRCPTQWQYGAFGILISWVALLYYVQFMPVIGIYVAMLSVILRKFMNFLLVLIILISGFALSFHMLFQNYDAFKNSGLSYIKTALMIAGEFNFDDYMYNDNTETYYKLAYFMYILFAIVMTILVTNLLIGLAVGDIPPLMKQATDHRNQLFFELVADYEIFRYQMARLLCRHDINDAIAYSYRDLDRTKWYKQIKHWLLKCIMQSDEDDQSNMSTEEHLAQQATTLQELNKQIYVVVEQTKTKSAGSDRINIGEEVTGMLRSNW